MRKVNLTMDENQKYTINKKLVETDGKQDSAAFTLGCTKKHVNRMIHGYKKQGKAFFVYGNRGRKPAHVITEETKQNILDFLSYKILRMLRIHR